MQAKSVYIGRNGEQLGPYDQKDLTEMLAAGAILPTDLAWCEGMAGWENAFAVLQRLGVAIPRTAPVLPASEAPAPSQGDYGSLEKSLSGDYSFQIGKILEEAWAKTSGAKGSMWLAFLAYTGILLAVSFVLGFLLGPGVQPGASQNWPMELVKQLILSAITLPVVTGIYLLGIRRAVGQPIPVSSIFGYYGKVVPLLLTMILFYVLVAIGFLLLVIPGIYLMVAYFFAMPLVVEKNLGPWEALETSRKAVTTHWFTMFGFMLVNIVIVIVSALPLGIGLIWTVPLLLIAYGIVYRNIFGCEGLMQGKNP